MWVHPDLLKDEQWSSPSIQEKMWTYNTISINFEEDYTTANALTESEEEALAMIAHQDEPNPNGT